MAKLSSKAGKSSSNGNFWNNIIPEKYQDLALILTLVVSVFIFFGGAIFGNGFNASDTLASHSFDNFIKASKESGEFPLWVPYIFGGMPSYSSLLLTGDRWWDFPTRLVFGATEMIGSLLANDLARVVCYYAIYAIGIYLLLRSKKIQRSISFFSGFAAAFSTSVLTWAMIGHNTKPVVLAFLPFIFLFLEKLRERFSLLYSVLLAIVLHIMLEAGHLQMIFYSMAAVGVYLLIELIAGFIKKENYIGTLRAIAILVLAGGLAFVMSSDRYLSVREYTKYSTRGSAPIVKEEGKSVDAEGGNTYEYATMWSFIPQDMKTFLIPNFYGFGKLDYDVEKNPNTLLAQVAQSQGGKLPSYFSRKTSEDAPPYMGITVFVLGIIGFIIYRKNLFVMSLFAVSVFSLFLSFGNEISFLYDIFYHNFPNFNKFRAPSMALVLMQFSMPILAGFGIKGLIDLKDDAEKLVKNWSNALIGLGIGFLALGFVYTMVFESSYKEEVASSKVIQYIPQQYQTQFADELGDFVWNAMISDWYINGFLLLATLLVAYLYLKNKTQAGVFITVAILVMMIDLWRVGYRPMEIAETKLVENALQKTDVYQFLDQDKSTYRIVDATAQSPNVPASFFQQSVDGYHSAKLRVYQDLLDVTSGGSTSNMQNPFVWNLMNVKYIIYAQQLQGMTPVFQSQQTGAFVYQNTNMLERASFVNKVEVAQPLDILNKMVYEPGKVENFDPKQVAFVEKALSQTIDTLNGTEKASVKQFKSHYIEIEATASANNFLFISEIYYPAGWKAYLDGKEVEIIKTNYAFRGIVVPVGTHKIEMKFTDEKFETGKTLSLATNSILMLLLALSLFIEFKSKKAQNLTTSENE